MLIRILGLVLLLGFCLSVGFLIVLVLCAWARAFRDKRPHGHTYWRPRIHI